VYVPATKGGCPIQAVFWLEWDTTALDQWRWMARVSRGPHTYPDSPLKLSIDYRPKG
jgi:hypothetical protein